MNDLKKPAHLIQMCMDQTKGKKMIETGPTHETPADGNVFLDLGFAPEEAASLKAKTDRIISEKLAIKNTKIHMVKNLSATKYPRSS